MPKKKEQISSEEQSRRFLEEAQKLIDAGELNLTGVDDRIDRVLLGLSKVANNERIRTS